MNKEELHRVIGEQQPNICQVVAVKDSNIIYSDTWNDFKLGMISNKMIMFILLR